jgi:hypothetical protein
MPPRILDENLLDEDYPGQPSDNGSSDLPYEAIFNAPDYASFLKVRRTSVSREYEARTNSVLKSLMLGSLNAGNFPDAAAIIHYGPQFAKATGGLADSNDYARKAIDILTSPSSPVALFALAAVPMFTQLMRNHEAQLAEVPATFRERRRMRKAARLSGATIPKGEPRFTIKIGKRAIPIYLRMHVKGLSVLLSGFRAQTQPPDNLASRVFSDPELISVLEKQGIRLVQHGGE